MRIIYVTPGAIPSRAANAVHAMKMAAALAESGADVLLIGVAGDSASLSEVRRMYNVPDSFNLKLIDCGRMNHLRLFRFLAGIWRVIRNEKGALVYSRSIWASYMASVLKLKTIFETHAPIWEINTLECYIFKLLGRSHHLLFVVSITDALRSRYLERGFDHGYRYIVLPDACDSTRVSSGWQDSPISAGYVGGLYPGKGIELIVSIARALPDMAFVIAGGSPNDVDRWKKIAACDNIDFVGHVMQSRLDEVYNRFDIALVPNQPRVMTYGSGNVDIGSVTSPLKVFEYMSRRKIILSSDLPVLREVLDENVSVLLPHDRVDLWVQKLRDICNAPVEYRKMAERARDQFLQNYTWKRRAERVIEEVEHINA